MKLICGVGVNDADYNVYSIVDGKKQKCPYYARWTDMMKRCYSEKYQKDAPTYTGCAVNPEWLKFSNFSRWMEQQNWEGMQLDKDILLQGNKMYSPETCVFVTRETNLFLRDSEKARGDFPIGVTFHKGKFQSGIRKGGKSIYLGFFATPEEAHQAYRLAKWDLAVQLAAEQTDPRVAAALIERYKL